MDKRYKLILSNKNMYREINLSPEDESVQIGTTSECDYRLRKDLFFSPVKLILNRAEDSWVLSCSENAYITTGEVKLYSKRLEHGDELFLRYQGSSNDIFSLSYTIDFDYEEKDYVTAISLEPFTEIKVGAAPANIELQDDLLGRDGFEIVKQNGKLYVVDNGAAYGVFLNGSRISRRAELHSCDFISIVRFSFYYKDGKLYSPMYENMKINGLAYGKIDEHTTHFKYPKFNRNTRIQYQLGEEELEIQQAAQKPSDSKKSLVMSLIPSVVMLAMTIVLRGIIGGGGTFVIYSAVSMSMGIIMSVVTYIQDKKTFKEETENRIKTYHEYVEKKREEFRASRENEIRILRLIYESLENSISEALSFGRRLFERKKGNADFLKVYLGTGTIRSGNQVKYPEQEMIDTEDPLAPIPKQVSEEFEYIENAPVISDFNSANGIGITGTKEQQFNILKNITLDISARHFFNEVKLVYLLDEEMASRLSWIRWLRNVENAELDIRNIACDEESRGMLLEHLYSVLTAREAEKQNREERRDEETNDAGFNSHYVVFVMNAASIISHPISKYFETAAQYDFTFVFLEEYEEFIPLGCSEIIRINSTKGLTVNTGNGDLIQAFTAPSVSDEVAENVALKLGAVSVDEVSLDNELTKNITLFEMLGILSIDDIDLEERWKNSVVYKSLAAPLGVNVKKEIVYLDISDKSKAHGPHGLVAGTTGSGKSEILQTYILSLATLFHPYEVGFVIIDFKGGGMANQFKDLPHLIGTITNIDGHEINRSLLSIKAELVKRQEIFSRCGVNHINDYIKLYKGGKVDIPLPHLIMIVDEFAELKAEFPDFMKELISAARIGRTLGVHLILATQKPSGVVDAQIWSNSKFKLCLKVQTKEDSNEVLKTPLAAEIVEPGRAYFQVGNNEIFELFQSAYSGAEVPDGDDIKNRTYSLFEKNLCGKKSLIYSNKGKKAKETGISQLQAIVDYVNGYCAEKGIEKLPGICLPSLKCMIDTEEMDYGRKENTVSVPIGVFDDPEQQMQGAVNLDPSQDNVYIVGSSQTGKTVLLQTLIYGLIRKYTPEEVNLYIVDCGNMTLKVFEKSRHVGGVVLSTDDEKCRNLFKMLNGIILKRKKLFSEIGVSNFNAYRESGYTDLPLIAVFIDNIAAFKEYFPDEFEEIGSIVREALGVGISFIITSTISNALNYRIQASFGRKFAFNCNDTSEYSTVFGHCKEEPQDYPGRGLLMQDKRVLEFQAAIFGGQEKEAEKSSRLREFVESRNAECSGSALVIPMVPEVLRLSDFMSSEPALFREPGIIPIGMDFANVSIVKQNLKTSGLLALTGDSFGRERFVRTFLEIVRSNVVFHNLEVTIVDDKTGRFSEYESCGFVRSYSRDAGEGQINVIDFCTRVLNEENGDMLQVLILNSLEVLRKICAERADSKTVSDALKVASEQNAFFLLSAVENQQVGFNASDVLKTVKDMRQGILFAPVSENKLFELQGRTKAESAFDSTMGYRFDGNYCYRIKMFE